VLTTNQGIDTAKFAQDTPQFIPHSNGKSHEWEYWAKTGTQGQANQRKVTR
jgi:hypothetical protein